MGRDRGTTLVELLVAMAVMAVITLAMTAIFNQSKAAYHMMTGKIALSEAARNAMGRITPLITSAALVGSQAIYTPASTGDQSTQAVFSTTEDWLSPSYPSSTTSATSWEPYPGSSPAPGQAAVPLNYFLYRITLVSRAGDPDDGDIVLEKVKQTAPGTYATVNPSKTRVLARARQQAGKAGFTFTGLQFTKLHADAVQVSVSLQGQVLDPQQQKFRNVNYTLTTVADLPQDAQ